MPYVSAGCKELKRTWPHVSGLTAGTTKQEGRQTNLLPQGKLGVKSRILHKDRIGL